MIYNYITLYDIYIYWDEKIVSFPFGNQATKYAS